MKDNLYETPTKIYSDDCWNNAKDLYNNNIEKYATYYNNNAEVKKPTGTLPDVALEHPNLRGRPGYGLADAYLIDVYSSLRNNPEGFTQDKCHIQLFERMFKGGPMLKGASGNIFRELDVLSGSDSRSIPAKPSSRGSEITGVCNKSDVMESQTSYIIPLIDCMKDIQDPENIIPKWTRGGEDTRSYLNKIKYSKRN